MLHNVKITPLDAGHYAVELDGKPVNGVTDVQITMSVDSLPVVWMGVTARSVDVELLNADVEMEDNTKTNCIIGGYNGDAESDCGLSGR